MTSSEKWWSVLSDECPITLEPLSSLPYPPFILRSGSFQGQEPSKQCSYYFDGLALATYVVSQGTFANPLTREPLRYDDCVRLDDYLLEHLYKNKDSQSNENFQSTAMLGLATRGEISVREAWMLRDSIKVKTGGNQSSASSSNGSRAEEEQRIRRAETLRNEASVALRGLFVFGHYSDRRRAAVPNSNVWTGDGTHSQTLPRGEGGFNLNYAPDSSNNHSWGMESENREGLVIVDDQEEAFDAAALSAWREMQDAFPHLTCNNNDGDHIPRPVLDESDEPSDLLQSVRQTAELTQRQENERAERIKHYQQRQFIEAFERKRNRVMERKKANTEVANMLLEKKNADHELQSARAEIDRWRAMQWEQWEQIAAQFTLRAEADSKNQQSNGAKLDATKVKQEDESSLVEDQTHSAAERQAAKKAAKRQRAKERAKEKKRLERIEKEKEERALAIKREKELSAMKCGACGEGVLGCGFEKFGVKFCSTSCARNGPRTS